MLLNFGFQSHIEFERGEEVQNISLGDTYAWHITPLGHRLFIKPIEKDVTTNMTIITTKRIYHFDLVSKDLDPSEQDKIVYQVKFYYPEGS
jgi:type IV secretion system protein VirB9